MNTFFGRKPRVPYDQSTVLCSRKTIINYREKRNALRFKLAALIVHEKYAFLISRKKTLVASMQTARGDYVDGIQVEYGKRY